MGLQENIKIWTPSHYSSVESCGKFQCQARTTKKKKKKRREMSPFNSAGGVVFGRIIFNLYRKSAEIRAKKMTYGRKSIN